MWWNSNRDHPGEKLKKAVILLSPFLVVIASFSFLYFLTSITARPETVIRPILIMCGILFGLKWPVYWLTQEWRWSSALLVIIVVGFCSSSFFAYVFFISVAVIMALLWITYTVLKKKLELFHLFVAMNAFSIVIIIWSGFWLYSRYRLIPHAYFETLPDGDNAYILNPSSSTKPDIYYIVVDGYGRADILDEFYGYNNSLFLDQLRDLGFVIPGQNQSNYTKTVLSITSSLNMDYIDSFAPDLNGAGFWWLMSPWLDHNRVRMSLEKIGYTSVSISSGWDITDNQTTDLYLKSHPVILNDFEKQWLARTPLEMSQAAFDNTLSVTTYDGYRQTQLHNFAALSTIPGLPGPKFVFAHIILPHPPFVFMADGKPIDPEYSFTLSDASDYHGSRLQYREKYIAQLQFLNSSLKSTIHAILQGSAQPPLIILQSDHGPGMLTDFSSLANSCLPERYSNFSAYYLPGIDQSVIPDDITPVNLFRIIFNEYFDADFALLENKQYFSTHPFGIYDLQEVTDLVGSNDNCVLDLGN